MWYYVTLGMWLCTLGLCTFYSFNHINTIKYHSIQIWDLCGIMWLCVCDFVHWDFVHFIVLIMLINQISLYTDLWFMWCYVTLGMWLCTLGLCTFYSFNHVNTIKYHSIQICDLCGIMWLCVCDFVHCDFIHFIVY